MPNQNASFLSNPTKFAASYALYPVAADGTDAEILHYADTAKTFVSRGPHGGHQVITQIKNRGKICFCDVEAPVPGQAVPADLFGSYDRDKFLYVMKIDIDRQAQSSFPVYYLPWDANANYRIKLKPSPHYQRSEG